MECLKEADADVNKQMKVWVYIDVLILLGWLHCNYAGKRDSRG